MEMELALPSGVLPVEPGDPAEIGGCAVAGRLGAGGTGVVYLGRDRSGGLVAVKVAHAGLAGDEEVRARFRAEAACLRRVPAPYTARLLTDGTDRTPPYLVTDYLAGRSLKEVVQDNGPLAAEQLRGLAAGVARTLVAVHRADLIHRDLKPANVLLTAAGPKVIDFGIAQHSPASGGPTGTGMVVGSVGWIAPERLTRHPATPASDVFGWGCLVAYAGTARNPFGSGGAEAMAARAICRPPDLDGLDASLRPLVAAALAKTPADRPTAEDLVARLTETTRLDATPIERAPGRRRALAATAMAAFAAATWIATQAQQATPHGRDPAVRPAYPSPAAPASASLVRESPVRQGRPAEDRRKPGPRRKHSDAGKPGHTKRQHGRP
jgi:eukaryotic-like serine/threonine-protein kinase